MVMEQPAPPPPPPTPQYVGLEFVRQYYTVLNQSPMHLHRFYGNDSSFVHGGLDTRDRSVNPAYGQERIHAKILELGFRDCHAKIRQVDSHSTIGEAIVIQVTGELSNRGNAMRRFVQTFVLAQKTPKKYYVLNDIFRYQDFVEADEESCGASAGDEGLEEGSSGDQSPTTGTGGETGDDEGGALEGTLVNGTPCSDVSSVPTIMGPGGIPVVVPATAVVVNNKEHHGSGTNELSVSDISSDLKKEEDIDGSYGSGDAPSSMSPMSTGIEEKGDEPTPSPPTQVQQQQAATQQEPKQSEIKTYANLFKSSASAQAQSQPMAATGQPAKPWTGGGGGSGAPPAPGSGGFPKRSPTERGGSQGQGQGKPPMSNGENDRERGDDRRRSNFPDSHQLFVGNLQANTTEEEMTKFFEQFGNVVEFRITRAMERQKSKANFGFVVFDAPDPVRKILNEVKVEPLKYRGLRLNVEEKRSRPSGGGDRFDDGGPPMRGAGGGRGMGRGGMRGGMRGGGGGGGYRRDGAPSPGGSGSGGSGARGGRTISPRLRS